MHELRWERTLLDAASQLALPESREKLRSDPENRRSDRP